MGIIQHSPKYIKKATGDKAAMVVSMPNEANVNFKTAEEVLSGDLNLTGNVAAKTVSIKVFGTTEVVPTEARMQEVLGRLDSLLTRDEYANIEAQQLERFNKALEAVDLKDLDTLVFLDYWTKAAKIEDVTALQTRCTNLETENKTQKTLIDGLTAELAKRPHSQKRITVPELFKDANGNSYFEIALDAGLSLSDAVVFTDGILTTFDYTVSATGRVTFVGDAYFADKIQVVASFVGTLVVSSEVSRGFSLDQMAGTGRINDFKGKPVTIKKTSTGEVYGVAGLGFQGMISTPSGDLAVDYTGDGINVMNLGFPINITLTSPK